MSAPGPPSDVRPWRMQRGERVGRWTLVEPLGQGGFSEVWRARRTLQAPPGTGDPPVPDAALKVVVHPEHARQLRDEARSLVQVRGRGIVAVREVDLAHDPPYLVMDLVEGGSLRPQVRRLELVAAIDLFRRVLQPLARVHRQGVVHGDLKPENILVAGSVSLLLADFGLSRRISQRTASLSVSLSQEDARLAGTLDYMAPEQRRGERATTQSDVYACGVLLHELVTGARPQGRFRLPGADDPSVPAAVDRLLACCLAADPRHRFATAGAVLAYVRGNPWNDWRRLSRAHDRVTGLLAEGSGVRTLASPFGWPGISAVVAVAAYFALVKNSGLLAAAQRDRALIGIVVGALLVTGLGLWLRPRFVARVRALEALKERLAAQLRAGQQLAQASMGQHG